MNPALSPSPYTRNELMLQVTPAELQDPDCRGILLARAVGGRWAREIHGFYFTPGRGRKWECLYAAGFTARPAQCLGGWRFIHPSGPRNGMLLHDAMRIGRAIMAERKPAAPNPIPALEAEFA